MGSYTRHRHGRGFTYRMKGGGTLRDKKVRRWIEGLMIPPGWRNVVIEGDIHKKVLATGRDQAGRKQYIYNLKYRQKKEREKFERMVRFGRQLPNLRQVLSKHLQDDALTKRKVLACMVSLIDRGHFRPGNPHYTEKNNTFGLQTLRSKHLKIEGSRLIFDYIGKSGKRQIRTVEDQMLAEVVAELDDLQGYEIFKYLDGTEKKNLSCGDLNLYIKGIMGEDFSAKDFRTWAGTVLAVKALAQLHQEPCEKHRPQEKKSGCHLVSAIKRTAKQLGNTPSVARSHYIDPRVISSFEKGKLLKALKRMPRTPDELATEEERVVLQLLG